MYETKAAWVRWPDNTQTEEQIAMVSGVEHVVIAHKGVFFVAPLHAVHGDTSVSFGTPPPAREVERAWLVSEPPKNGGAPEEEPVELDPEEDEAEQ